MTLIPLLARSSWHFYRQHPAQLLLSILGIVLGVAIVTAVLITNHSSQRAFALSSEALYGRTTHQLTGASAIDQQAYVHLRTAHPNLLMAPVIEGHVAIGDTVYSILGLDPFSEAFFARARIPIANDSLANTNTAARTQDNEQASMIGKLLQPDTLLISQTSVEDSTLNSGDTVDLIVGGKRTSALLAGTFTSSNPAASTGLLIGDIAFVQRLLQRGERIDRIDLIITDDEMEALQRSLPESLEITPAASRHQTMQAMTRGFHINLTAMSLLALLVGVFLIHNTMTFAVVQRREQFAIKRITGILPETILLSILTEAFVISLIGSLLGILLGFVVAQALIQLTTQTINDLYFVLHVQQLWFSPWLIVAGLLLGVGSSLIAASLSALDAASTSPVQARQRSVLEQRTQRILPLFAGAGVLIMITGLLLAALPSQSLLLGFGALMLLIMGYGMTLPWLVGMLTRTGTALSSPLGITMTLALGGIARNISRTGIAIAALTIAVSATFGVDVMIGSFRASVDRWLGSTLQSDIYITTPSTVTSQSATLLGNQLEVLARNTPGVQSVSSGRIIPVSTPVGTIDMLVVKPHAMSQAGFELIQGDTKKAWHAWESNTAVMISEPLATKHNLAVGSKLVLLTENRGRHAFTIAAVFRDFGSSHGKLLMSRELFSRFWNDPRIGSLGIVLKDKNNDAAVIDALRARLATPQQPLIIQSNTDIHQQSLAVFDRTFEVTRVLRWLTVGVAFVGIFSALLALHLERAREFAIYRATGATQAQIMIVVCLQTLIMGLFAGLLALPLGWMMSEVLIKVINVRSFGWTMYSLLPKGAASQTILLACTSAMLAGLYPAWRLSRSAIATQLRDE